MPHVIVKLWPGKSEEQKRRLAQEIAKDVMSVLNYGDESVSVAMEEVEPVGSSSTPPRSAGSSASPAVVRITPPNTA